VRLRDETRLAVLGITATGKSHYVKHRVVKRATRCVVWDVHSEYAEPCNLDEVSLDELLNEPELLADSECKLAVVPEWDDPKELALGFTAFVAALKDSHQSQSMAVIIDEVGLLRPHADGQLVALAAQSRHWRMPLVLVAQRATMLPPGARAQLAVIVSFRQNDPGDIDALSERIGAERAQRVAELQKHKFVVWTQNEAMEAQQQEQKK